MSWSPNTLATWRGARELAQSAVTRSRTSGSTYWLSGFLAQLGFIETSARNWQAALQALREVAEIFTSTKMVDLEQLLWGVDYADAALQIGATQDVEAAISVLRRQAAAGRPEAAVAADRCQALLTAARGDVDNAVSELRRVVSRPGSECRFEAARSRLALGQVYRRVGYKGQASEVLNTAAGAFEELGIPRWAERARDEAGRVGLHPTHEHAHRNRTPSRRTRCIRTLKSRDRCGTLHVGQDRRSQPHPDIPQTVCSSRTELANRLKA